MDEKISFALHHGGQFKCIPFYYKGGKTEYYHDYNIDKISYFELRALANEASGKRIVKLFFKPAAESFEISLRMLNCEKDIEELLNCRRDLGPIDVFALDEDACLADLPKNVGNENDEKQPVNGDGSDDDKDSIASLGHISDDEEELIEVRKKLMEKKKNLKVSEKPNEGTVVDESDSDGEYHAEEDAGRDNVKILLLIISYYALLYFNSLPMVAEGDTAKWITEIYQRESSSSSTQRLVFSRYDVAELDALLCPSSYVDAYFSLDPYNYQQNAGIRLVAKKLIIHSN